MLLAIRWLALSPSCMKRFGRSENFLSLCPTLQHQKSDAEEEGSEKIEPTIKKGDEVEAVYEMNLYKSQSLVNSVHIIYSHCSVRRRVNVLMLISFNSKV